MDVHAVEAAMSRLASQHYLSDYNQMKRGVPLPMPQQSPAVPAYSYPKPPPSRSSHPAQQQQQQQQPPGHHSSSGYSGGNVPGTGLPRAGYEARPQSRYPVVSRRTAGPEIGRGGPASGPSANSTDDASSSAAAYALLALNPKPDYHPDPLPSRTTTNELVPPAPPRLERTYTEEEGENPRSARIASPPASSSFAAAAAVAPAFPSATGPPVVPSAQGTPALSMSSSASSVVSLVADRSGGSLSVDQQAGGDDPAGLASSSGAGGRGGRRRDSSAGPVTPPDHHVGHHGHVQGRGLGSGEEDEAGSPPKRRISLGTMHALHSLDGPDEQGMGVEGILTTSDQNNTSPVMQRTNREERVERELSARLLDAMEDAYAPDTTTEQEQDLIRPSALRTTSRGSASGGKGGGGGGCGSGSRSGSGGAGEKSESKPDALPSPVVPSTGSAGTRKTPSYLTPAQRALSGLGITRIPAPPLPLPHGAPQHSSLSPASYSMSASVSTSAATLASGSGAGVSATSMARTVSEPAPGYKKRHDYSHPALVGVKTSLSHPMNVSPLIPVELLPLYGQKILLRPHSHRQQQQQQQAQLSRPGSRAEGMHVDEARARSPLGNSRYINVDAPTRERSTSPAKSPSPSPASISKGIRASGDEDMDTGKRGTLTSIGAPFVLAPSADLSVLTVPNATSALFSMSLPIAQTFASSSSSSSSSSAGVVSGSPAAAPKLGNLVLSSCPGKKVRLSDTHLEHLGIPSHARPGPLDDPRANNGIYQQAQLNSGLAAGASSTGMATSRSQGAAAAPSSAVIAALGAANARSPICRDIELDFRRAMELSDIKVVVCCIDNEELRFLGAPWEEYERVAEELGLEVIRLPMAEGFAPSSPELLDAPLAHLIARYTLRGESALVHCRGGVGRAGLFACSWLLKLGLLGPVKGIHDPAGGSVAAELEVVERVVQLIRRRRSAKAIETPQQVHFILKYVNWLSRCATEVNAWDVLDAAAEDQ